MMVRLDKSIDAAYIRLKNEINEGEVAKTYPCDFKSVGFELNLDFDESGVLIGIEVHHASKHLPPALLNNAIVIDE